MGSRFCIQCDDSASMCQCTLSAAVAQKQSYCLTGSDLAGTGNRRGGGAEHQSLVSVPNIPGLNPKLLRSAYDMKAYTIRP